MANDILELFGEVTEDAWGWILFAGIFLGGFSAVVNLIKKVYKHLNQRLDRMIKQYSYKNDDGDNVTIIRDGGYGVDKTIHEGNVYIENSTVRKDKVKPKVKPKVKIKSKPKGTFGYDPKIGGTK